MPIEHVKWDEENRELGFQEYKSGRDLLVGGDINLNQFREEFQVTSGRSTTLTDDELLVVYQSTDDDDDDERCSYVSSAEAYFATDEGKAAMNNCIAELGIEPLTPREPTPESTGAENGEAAAEA